MDFLNLCGISTAYRNSTVSAYRNDLDLDLDFWHQFGKDTHVFTYFWPYSVQYIHFCLLKVRKYCDKCLNYPFLVKGFCKIS